MWQSPWAGTADAMPSGAWIWCGRTSNSLCCASATLSRGHLKCEAQPTPSQMSATARWHQQLGPPRRVCCDLAGRRLPEAASAQELTSGRLAPRMHTEPAVPSISKAWYNTLHVPAPATQLHQRTPAMLQALSQVVPLYRCRTVAGWLAHLF